ncbi:MAG: hypothetical protein Q7S34_01845 [bacterium]|nr:hypothetical protein [bacterium]
MQEIRWTDLEYPHRPKSVDWFWGLGLLAIAVAGLSIFLGNLLFGLLFIAGSASIGIFAVREPKEIEYIINDKGVLIGDSFHSYDELGSFYVDRQEQVTKLILTSKKLFSSYLVIDITEHNPDAIHDALIQKLPEVEHREPLLHAVAERLGI